MPTLNAPTHAAPTKTAPTVDSIMALLRSKGKRMHASSMPNTEWMWRGFWACLWPI